MDVKNQIKQKTIPCKITTIYGDPEPLKSTRLPSEHSMLRHQMAFRWRADVGLLIALSLINCKLDLDQKRRRNASIRINSLFVVTIRIVWYVSVYRSFSERYNSLSSVGFKTLQCADIRFISQIIAEMRL